MNRISMFLRNRLVICIVSIVAYSGVTWADTCDMGCVLRSALNQTNSSLVVYPDNIRRKDQLTDAGLYEWVFDGTDYYKSSAWFWNSVTVSGQDPNRQLPLSSKNTGKLTSRVLGQ